MIQQRQISLVKTLVVKTFPGGLWNLNPNFKALLVTRVKPTSQGGVSLVMKKMIVTSCPLEDQCSVMECVEQIIDCDITK